MCLGIPMQIVDRTGDYGTVARGGVSCTASLHLVPDATVGDYVIVHAGIAIQQLSTDERDQIEILLAEIETALSKES